MNKNFLNKNNKFGKIIPFTLIYGTFILIIFFPYLANSDYPNYYKLFIHGDYYSKLEIHQLSLFTLLTSIFNDFVNYRIFRSILAIIQVIGFSIIFRKLKFKYSNLTIFTCLPFLTFFLLKVHVQIRESLAILLWMFAILDINKKNFFNPKNLVLLVMSFFMHISVLFWWIPSIIYSLKRFSYKTKTILFTIFFSIIGILAGSPLLKIIVNYILSNDLKTLLNQIQKYDIAQVVALNTDSYYNYNVEITSTKILYWLCYGLILISIFIDEKRRNTEITKKSFSLDTINFFGFIGLYGTIVFVPFAILFASIEDFTTHGYNYIFRTLFILVFLLSLYRSSTSPKSILTIIINSWLFIDMSRVVFAEMEIFIKSYL